MILFLQSILQLFCRYNLAQKIKKRKNDIKYVEAPDETSTEITIKRIKLEDIHSPYLVNDIKFTITKILIFFLRKQEKN